MIKNYYCYYQHKIELYFVYFIIFFVFENIITFSYVLQVKICFIDANTVNIYSILIILKRTINLNIFINYKLYFIENKITIKEKQAIVKKSNILL